MTVACSADRALTQILVPAARKGNDGTVNERRRPRAPITSGAAKPRVTPQMTGPIVLDTDTRNALILFNTRLAAQADLEREKRRVEKATKAKDEAAARVRDAENNPKATAEQKAEAQAAYLASLEALSRAKAGEPDPATDARVGHDDDDDHDQDQPDDHDEGHGRVHDDEADRAGDAANDGHDETPTDEAPPTADDTDTTDTGPTTADAATDASESAVDATPAPVVTDDAPPAEGDATDGA